VSGDIATKLPYLLACSTIFMLGAGIDVAGEEHKKVSDTEVM
jgi:hypothetical protein